MGETHSVRDEALSRNIENSESQTPWLIRPVGPDGARRPGVEQVVGNGHLSGADSPLPVRNKLAQRQWLVRLIARRAVEILAEDNDEQ